MLKQFFTVEEKSIDKDKRIVRGVVGSTGDKDRHGDTVNPEGWVLDNYLKNPTILFGHDYWSFPVGSAIKVAIENAQLVFDIYITDKTQVGRELWDLICEGTVKAVSVGYRVMKYGVEGTDLFTHMQQELLELSFVPVGSNPNAGNFKSFLEKTKDIAPAIYEKSLQGSELAKHLDVITDTKIAEATKDFVTETRVKEIVSEELEKSNKEVEPEVVEPSAELVLLTSIRDELRGADKGIGLTLRQLNEFLVANKY